MQQYLVVWGVLQARRNKKRINDNVFHRFKYNDYSWIYLVIGYFLHL